MKNNLALEIFILLLNLIIFSLLSVLVVMGSDIILKNKLIEIDRMLTNPTDIIGKFNNTFLTIVAIISLYYSHHLHLLI